MYATPLLKVSDFPLCSLKVGFIQKTVSLHTADMNLELVRRTLEARPRQSNFGNKICSYVKTDILGTPEPNFKKIVSFFD